ncbi:MAG: sigma 54-interacting transcriptional regulator [Pseudomonadota bacterium]
MCTKKNVIAISPSPDLLVMAARCRKQWDDMAVAGSGLIVQVLRRWEKESDIGEGIVLLAHVSDPKRVRTRLEGLSQKGQTIRWIAPAGSRSVQAACDGLPHVRLVTGASMREAFEKSTLPEVGTEGLSDAVAAGSADLLLYCRYKIAMSLLMSQAPAPLREAADLLSGCTKGPFTAKSIPARDRPSVQRFAAADFPYLAGYSDAVQALNRRVQQVGATDLSVLILGETGTGKESVAFYLHEFSDRRDKPLVALNCAGLDEQLLRSELFGHHKGAFTGAAEKKKGLVEEADGGTLFLDEVAEMPLAIQAALLRFLQNGSYTPVGGIKEKKADVRIIAATQPGLEQRMGEGRFRKDLYYRLADVVLRTPALRDIQSDLRYITNHLLFGLVELNPKLDVRSAKQYFEDGEATLRSHSWPGNVRELAGMIKRKLMLGDDVLRELRTATGSRQHPSAPAPAAPVDVGALRSIDDVVQDYVKTAWSHRGKLTQRELAKRLGKSVNTVRRIMKGP